MSREDEIRERMIKSGSAGQWTYCESERILEIKDIGPETVTQLMWARSDIDYLLAENARLRTRCEALEEHIGKTADGVCLHECESHYCPHCNNKIERGDSFTAYCDHCPNPDGGAYPAGPPLPMFWEQTLANTREPAK